MKRLGEVYRTALVTGGTSGLGESFCGLLLREGVDVTSVSRYPEVLPAKDGFRGEKLDLSDAEATQAFTHDFLAEHGAPDLLVNNAGYGAFYEWANFPEEEIGRQVETLLTGPARLCQAFAPAMAERGSGGIVNVSSIAGLFPLPYMPMYNAAKAGLSAFSASLALEYAQVPFVVDFRLGDFRTNFNAAAKRGKESEPDSAVGRAWVQIEKQLDDSPEADEAARALRRILVRGLSGVTYAGGFFQAQVAPVLFRLAPKSWLRAILRKRYGL